MPTCYGIVFAMPKQGSPFKQLVAQYEAKLLDLETFLVRAIRFVSEHVRLHGDVTFATILLRSVEPNRRIDRKMLIDVLERHCNVAYMRQEAVFKRFQGKTLPALPGLEVEVKNAIKTEATASRPEPKKPTTVHDVSIRRSTTRASKFAKSRP